MTSSNETNQETKPERVPNPSPKTRYIARGQPFLSNHVALVSSDEFRVLADMALLEYARLLQDGTGNELGSCASSHLRLLGASEIIGVMLNLHVASTAPAIKIDMGNLGTNRPR